MKTGEIGMQFKASVNTLAALLALAASSALHAQAWPAKPVRMIVAYPPGASTDVLARLVSQQLGERLNTPVVVENRAGASGIVGTEQAARAPADGYNLLFAQQDTHTLLPILKRKLPYDADRDFVPLAKVGDVYLMIVANGRLAARNVKELLEMARAKPGGLRFSSAGNGGINHLVLELFGQRSGVELTHIPYNGGAPATLAVIAGEVELFGGSRTLLAKAIDAGQLRGVGIAQGARSAFLPNLPTMAEVGVPDFVVSAWFGVFAPTGLPEGIANRLADTLVSIGSSEDYQKRLIAAGGEGQPLGRDAFAKFLKAESGRWRVVIEKAGIRIED